MRNPLHVLVIDEERERLDRHVAAVDRIGHFGHGVLCVEEARSRRGRIEPAMVLFSPATWADGGPDLVREFAGRGLPCRVLIVGDYGTVGRSPEFVDQGAQGVLLDPLSTAELDRAVDGLMLGPAADVRTASGEVPQPDEIAATSPVTQQDGAGEQQADEQARAQILALADRLRRGETRLPNVSPVAMELQGLCASDDAPNLTALVSRIEQDPSLAAAVLRASNAAAYRGMPAVLDLVAAGRRLGTRRMGEVAQMEAIKGAFLAHKGSGWSRLLARMWRNTVTTAFAARLVATRLGLAARGEIYSMALFHNLGEILVVDLFRQMGEQAPRSGRAEGRLKREMDRQHAALGALLLKSWGMPLALARIAFAHHDPSVLPPGTPLARHAWLVGGCYRAVVDAGCEYKSPTGDEGPPLAVAATVLGIPAEGLVEAAAEAVDWWTGRDDGTAA